MNYFIKPIIENLKSYLLRTVVILVLSLLIFPCFSQKREQGKSTVHEKKQYVVIKFDDLKNTNWKSWKTITDIVIAKDVTADLGIFTKSLESGDEEYFKYLQSLINDPKHFEIWLHGYTGEAKEFYDSDYDTQLSHFNISRSLMLEKYDYILRNYGGHYYGGNEHTKRIINEDPFLKGSIFSQSYKKIGPEIIPSKQVMAVRKVSLEPKVAVPSFDTYKSSWNKANADTLPYVVLQGHPWGYTSETLQNEFIKVIDDLKTKGVIFTHFREYDRMVKGYLSDRTPPSTPSNLKGIRQGNKIHLTWNASKDKQSGVDCYKIYRNDICIGLSASNSFTDEVSGNHKYTIRAVNNNDMVSKKSGIVKLR